MISKVEQFFDKNEIPTTELCTVGTQLTSNQLVLCSALLKTLTATMRVNANVDRMRQDHRLHRILLIIEELEEVIRELQKGNSERLAHELADLLYVVIGTAITFEIDIEKAFEEVHRKNMEKSCLKH